MRKLDILARPWIKRIEVRKMLYDWAERHDADVRPMGRLVRRYKTQGENLHWHITGLRKGMGTVEVTYLPSTGRFTVLVHDNRGGFWAGRAYENLAQELEEKVGILVERA